MGIRVTNTFKSNKGLHTGAFFLLVSLLFLTSTYFRPEPLYAQTDFYWEFESQGEIKRMRVVDLDEDGTDEILLLSAGRQVTLIEANGTMRWQRTLSSDEATDQVLDLIILRQSRGVQDRRFTSVQPIIVLSTDSQLIFLDRDGDSLQTISLLTIPLKLMPIRSADRDTEDLLVATRTGELFYYDGRTAELRWQFLGSGTERPNLRNAQPLIHLTDVNGDGRQEILFAYEAEERFGELVLLDGDGTLLWRHPLSGRITALTAMHQNGDRIVIVGTDRGLVQTFGALNGEERWHRTLNRPITVLQAEQSGGSTSGEGAASTSSLLVGTNTGRFRSITFEGKSRFDVNISDNPDRAILSVDVESRLISSAAGSALIQNAGEGTPSPIAGEKRFYLVHMESGSQYSPDEEPNLYLLDESGTVLNRFRSLTRAVPPQLLDINGDEILELLLPSFSTLVLADSGVSLEDEVESVSDEDGRIFGLDWSFRLNARPTLFLPFPEDNIADARLWVGGDDGRLVILSRSNGQVIRELNFDGTLEAAVPGVLAQNGIAGAAISINRLETDDRGGEVATGIIDLLDANGNRLWLEPVTIPGFVNHLALADPLAEGGTQLYFGTSRGRIGRIETNGVVAWEKRLENNIAIFELIDRGFSPPELVTISVSGQMSIFDAEGNELRSSSVSPSSTVRHFASLINISEQEDLEQVDLLENDQRPAYLLIDAENRMTLLNESMITIAERDALFSAPISEVLATETHLFVADRAGELRAFPRNASFSFDPLWLFVLEGPIQELFQVDLTGEGDRHVLMSGADGQSELLKLENGQPSGALNLSSTIFAAAPSPIDTEKAREFALVLTENGVLRALSIQSNSPPLLVNADTVSEPNRYSVTVDVLDPDLDPVTVILYFWDNLGGEWVAKGERQAPAGQGTLSWILDPDEVQTPVRYRFEYLDEVNQGFLAPVTGVEPIPDANLFNQVYLPILSALALATVVVLGYRVSSSTFVQSRRYMREMSQKPEEMLFTLAEVYRRTAASPDILLGMAGQARNTEWRILADLCDGLYLMADRPQAGFDILSKALSGQPQTEDPSDDFDLRGRGEWHTLFLTARVLYTAPSVLELALQKSKFDRMLEQLNDRYISTGALEGLDEPLARLLAGSRIELSRDRLSYLYEADHLLSQQQAGYDWREDSIPNRIASTLNQRWRGLIAASISELQGRPWLIPVLKTRRLMAGSDTQVVISLTNEGQAPAQQVRIELAESHDFASINAVQTIPLLPVGRPVSANFSIQPHNRDDLRLTFSISYVDANNRFHHFEFADMATFLELAERFEPIPNPYAPGTPLRTGSPLFYGRRDLINFILNNAKQVYQQNVVVLVGQRRTGKTSILLNISEMVSDELLPVYVDCQSLGVVPGMAGFLHDLAWFISDAALLRDIEIDVPDLELWEKDPVHFFQRTFLPQLYAQVPDETDIMLIFDEFESFEDLVKAGILPPTFFPFLRHLMQHATRLSFVFAGTHLLEEMGSDYWSVLFNIALYRKVTYLETEALKRLITEPVAPRLVYDDLALEKIERVTAGHPYFAQLVCYTLVNYANRRQIRYITITDVNLCVSEMMRLGEVHFAYLWQASSFAERAILTSMAHLIDTERPVSPSDISESLEEYDYHLEPHEIVDGLRSLVAREIMQEYQDSRSSLYEIRVGLVTLWVSENKSLSKLYEA